MSDPNPRKRLLLIAATTGYQTRLFADTAHRLGLEVQLATDRCDHLEDPWGDGAIPVRFQYPDRYADHLARAAHFDAIVAVGDRPAYLAALTAQRLRLPFHSPSAVQAAGNKFLSRHRFRDAGLPVPEFSRLPITGDPAAAARRSSYPCVLKPLGLSASRGVIRADHPSQFVDAFHRIRALLESAEIARLKHSADRFILVEQFIPGREFAVEALLTGGRFQLLALFDKPDPLDGPFFAETIYVTPSRQPSPVRQAILDATQRAVSALGLADGPVHAEMRVNEDGVWILEVAPRPIGGLCAKALRFRPAIPLEELLLHHALGRDVSAASLLDPASGVMMIPVPSAGVYCGVAGLDQARSIAGIDEVVITAKQGQRVLPLPEGNTYLGFLFARGDSPQRVETALRAARAALRFDIATTLPVVANP